MLMKRILPCVFFIFHVLINAQYYRPFDPYYSQSGQDKYVLEKIFKHKKNGVFIDIGAHDGMSYSNTYYMEKELSWTGMCIEPQPEQFEKLQKNRNCLCINGCISNKNGQADFLVVHGAPEMLSGLVDTYHPQHIQRIDRELAQHGGSKETISINTYNLNDLCDQHGIKHVDFLSVDTEGSEETIIKSIDFNRLDITVIAVENNYNSNAIYKHLINNHYTYLGKLDGDELYIKTSALQDTRHYYCIPSDERHAHLLKNLIGSIHAADFENLGEIAVFDLGLSAPQRAEFESMEKVHVYDVEMVNKDLLTYFLTDSGGRYVRGHFAWKPVIIKQALDMFPYVLYLDAGTTVLKPMTDIFNCIREQGYFLVSCSNSPNCTISNRMTQNVFDALVAPLSQDLQTLIMHENTMFIDAGIQGLSRSMLDKYILPVYEHAKDIALFADDGTAKMGYGAGRHDQTLFSIYAYRLGLKIFPEGYFVIPFELDNKLMHIHWDPKEINHNTTIYRSRWDFMYQGGKSHYVKYKK